MKTLPPFERARRITLHWLAAMSWRMGCVVPRSEQDLRENIEATAFIVEDQPVQRGPS